MRLVYLLSALVLVGCTQEDVDGDGLVGEMDCDDRNPNVGEPSTYFVDVDRDGWGSSETVEACSISDGLSVRDGDCDDTVRSVHPDASEVCNEVDEDCDGFVDEGFDKSGWFEDADGDGFGDPEAEVPSCDGYGLARLGTDCDDTDASISPDAVESCNGIDDNCSGRVDEPEAADAPDWYADADGDGFGVDDRVRRSCESPGPLWTTAGGDCDDYAPAVHPGAEEVCNDTDDDCDGLVDVGASDILVWYQDYDRDGYGEPSTAQSSCDTPEGNVSNDLDCDDQARDVSPETEWYADSDGDGYGDASSILASCEQPSGYLDRMGDCDDTDATVNPKGVEVCDGVDNDCSGVVDEDATDAPTWYLDDDGDGYGSPLVFATSCEALPGLTVSNSADCDDADPMAYPGAPEYCDGADNDCDGSVDLDDPDAVVRSWYADFDEDGYGPASDTVESCEAVEGYILDAGDCDDDDASVHPGAVELCDAGLDNDCDGAVDLDDSDVSGDGTWYEDVDGDGWGDTSSSIRSCSVPEGHVRLDGDCDPEDGSVWNTCWSGIRSFTTCGSEGYRGPDQAECDAAYLATALEEEVGLSDGIQSWTVPWDGTYTISAWGAQGATAATDYSGGKGAWVQGSFELSQGDVLHILVGQQGTEDGHSAGGGGGSFVVRADGTPLLIAGGGGGLRVGTLQDGCDGSVGLYGGLGSGELDESDCEPLVEGIGEGGYITALQKGSGGGGFLSDGKGDILFTHGGSAWASGSLGGSDLGAGRYDAWGGFGGGGSGNGNHGSGGGGGYSGGDGGWIAGGGGSYNAGSATTGADGAREGEGLVTIEREL